MKLETDMAWGREIITIEKDLSAERINQRKTSCEMRFRRIVDTYELENVNVEESISESE